MNQKETEALLAEFKRIADTISDPAYQAELERRVRPRLEAAFRAHRDVRAQSAVAGQHVVLRQRNSTKETA